MRENVKYLNKWLREARELAVNLRARAKKEKSLAIFTIGSTVKLSDKMLPYLTPMRRIVHGFIGGSVVFSQTQAILLGQQIDGLVDHILVDAEKKIGITIGLDTGVLEYFGIQPAAGKDKARVHVEMGNLSAACKPYIKKSSFFEYKPNDITVDSVWQMLSREFGILSGKKIAVIGGGNIGFKIALKLVECGCNVEFVRRDLWRGMIMCDTINIVKPKSTIAIAHYNTDPLQASLFCDALIGCTNGVPVISWEMIQSMKPSGIVIDVGKGTVYKEAVRRAKKEGISISRCDITCGIDGFIAAIQRNGVIAKEQMGRRKISQGVSIVSGGCIGHAGDIVVDNYKTPKCIVGVADGSGDLKRKFSQRDKRNLKLFKKLSRII